MKKNNKKSKKIEESIIYGSKDYDYDDSSLSIYGINEDGEIDEDADDDLKEFNDTLEREIAEMRKNAPMKKKKKVTRL